MVRMRGAFEPDGGHLDRLGANREAPSPRKRGEDTSRLRCENPVAPRLQADRVACSEVTVARRVDLHHGVAIAGQRDVGALNGTEGPDAAHGAVERALTDRPDMHVVTAHE